MPKIHFFVEDTSFNVKRKTALRNWIEHVVSLEGFTIKCINYIFCSDSYLLQLNQQYLNHDTYTDIITFDNSEEEATIEADIYISIDRVNENAQKLKTPFVNELYRVMIHGALHLVGLKDKSKEDKRLMREKEDACLSLLKF